MGFNPRSPRGGATDILGHIYSTGDGFNPRSPRGGATFLLRARANGCLCFNPRSPRGGATLMGKNTFSKNLVSIHAPHEGERLGAGGGLHGRPLKFQSTLPTRGSDQYNGAVTSSCTCFNPRSPRGGATGKRIAWAVNFSVSIHAPHEGERRHRILYVIGSICFNPRSTRGGATLYVGACLCHWTVSIHAPHEGERQGW